LDNPINILSTRPVDAILLQEAAEQNVWIECLSFIDTTVCINQDKKERIKALAETKNTIVFTSMNAAEAIIESLDGSKPSWDIYCMGGTTKTIIKDYFGADSIKGTGKDALSLAEGMITNGTQETVFFCGNIRRDELPQLLKEHQIALEEMVVYETIVTPHEITKTYDAILFFSPSALDSFFSVNKIIDKTILFAIGNTTAKAIANYSTNTIVKADTPEKDNLVKKAIDYFTTNSNVQSSPLGTEGIINSLKSI
jgi:uroporphyrinogen-III synthase